MQLDFDVQNPTTIYTLSKTNFKPKIKIFCIDSGCCKISLMLFDMRPFIGPGLSTTSHPINTHFYCTIYMTTQQIAIVYGLCMFRCKVVIFCIFPPLWFVPPNQSTTIMPRGRNIFEWGEGVSDRLNGKTYADDWPWSEAIQIICICYTHFSGPPLPHVTLM